MKTETTRGLSMNSDLRPSILLLGTKMPALSALSSTRDTAYSRTLFGNSPTSTFPSTLDLCLQYTLFPLLKKVSIPFPPPSTTLYSLILFTSKKNSEELVYCLLVLFSQLNPFKSVYVFNIPPKPVKKKTQWPYVVISEVTAQTSFYVSYGQYLTQMTTPS